MNEREVALRSEIDALHKDKMSLSESNANLNRYINELKENCLAAEKKTVEKERENLDLTREVGQLKDATEREKKAALQL